MEELSLEREFELYKFIHMASIVEAQLVTLYKDMQNAGVTIPNFMEKSPEDKAREHLTELLNNKEEFLKTYKNVWDKVAEVLP